MREMSVLEDYEIVDAALRDRLAVLKADIDSMTGGGGVIIPYIINPHVELSNASWDTVYLNGKGAGQSGYTDLGNWNYDNFFKPNIYGTTINGEWFTSIPRLGGWHYYGDYAGMVFNSPINCRDYKYLKIKYYITPHDSCVYNRAYINLAKDTAVGEDSQTANNYRTVELCPEFGFVADSNKGNPLYNAEHEYWEWVTIDIGDIDEFYFSVSFNAREFYIIEAYLSNEGSEQLPPIVRNCSQVLYEHFGLKDAGSSSYIDEENEYHEVCCHWLDYTRTDTGYPIRPLTIVFVKGYVNSVGIGAEYIEDVTGLNNVYTYSRIIEGVSYTVIDNVDLSAIANDPVAVTKYIINNVPPSNLVKTDSNFYLQDTVRYSSAMQWPIYMYLDRTGGWDANGCTDYQLKKIQYPLD